MSIKSHFYCLIFQVTRSWLPLQPAGGSNRDGVSKVSAVRDYTKPEKVAVGLSSESWPPNNALPQKLQFFFFFHPFAKCREDSQRAGVAKACLKLVGCHWRLGNAVPRWLLEENLHQYVPAGSHREIPRGAEDLGASNLTGMLPPVFPILCQCLRCSVPQTAVVPALLIVAGFLLFIALNYHNFIQAIFNCKADFCMGAHTILYNLHAFSLHSSHAK